MNYNHEWGSICIAMGETHGPKTMVLKYQNEFNPDGVITICHHSIPWISSMAMKILPFQGKKQKQNQNHPY